MLLHSTGNYTQYLIINYNGQESERECVCVCGCVCGCVCVWVCGGGYCGGVVCVCVWRVCGISWWGICGGGVLCVCVVGVASRAVTQCSAQGEAWAQGRQTARLMAELLFLRPRACHRGLFLVQGRSCCSVHSERFTSLSWGLTELCFMSPGQWPQRSQQHLQPPERVAGGNRPAVGPWGFVKPVWKRAAPGGPC